MDNPKDRPEQFDARVTDLVIRLCLLGLFIYLSFALIRPFLPILVWALVIAVALAPVHEWLARSLGGRRIAAVLLGLVMLIVVLGPIAALSASLVETIHILKARIEGGALHLPPIPTRLSGLPLVGETIAAAWQMASTNLEGLMLRYRGAVAPLGARLLGLFSQIGLDLVRFILSILLASVLLVAAPGLSVWGRMLATRILAPRGEQFVEIVAQTIRNVSRGVVGIALLQSILISVVLQLAGVAGAGLLAFVILILCILQIGPALVVLPVLVWAWLTMSAGQAILLTALLLPLTFMDNVLKPMLMGRGLSTPAVVIFLGLIGGTLSFGLIGLFLGPVVLAVFYDLLRSWILYTDPSNE
ncbi:AI-2E family transporter [Paracoccus litorisediminis]|uniref:AI-2E family transporter n=1 Tax=Paracoccus litorisediminis TaxID=2006130 RepID=A0A844HRN5_9RHOB|nr:AI-2E family transporter [Paracoccus litorisediminis]MTH61728.1 AI-2E family transporter [Paracoccus litorisediminis]